MTATESHRAGWLSPSAFWIVFSALAVASFAAVAWWHAANLLSPQVFMHVDSWIPVAVKNHIREAGWPDTNWAHANLPDYPDSQYNFSSHIIAFTIFDNLSLFKDQRDLSLFSVLCWMGFVTVMTWTAARWLGRLGAAIVACGMLATPLLVQDSFYGRPESFLTLLCVVAFALSARDRWASQLFASAIVGFGLACKVSFAPFVIVTLATPFLLRGWAGWKRSAVSVPVASAGFVLGVPGALLDPDGFWRGVEFLRAQYSDFHWPYGSLDGELAPQLWHSLSYYLATIGPLAIAAIVIACASLAVFTIKPRVEGSVRAPRLHLLAFCAAAVGTVVFFSMQRTFFERNISHAVPILWMAVAWGAVTLASSTAGVLRHSRVRQACLVLLAVSMIPMGLMSYRIASVIGEKENHWARRAYSEGEQQALAANVPVVTVLAWHEAQFKPEICGAMRAVPGPVVLKVIAGAEARPAFRPMDERLVPLAVAKGPFNDVPISTLQTYHSAQVEYFLVRPELRVGECGVQP